MGNDNNTRSVKQLRRSANFNNNITDNEMLEICPVFLTEIYFNRENVMISVTKQFDIYDGIHVNKEKIRTMNIKIGNDNDRARDNKEFK